jgi:multisubunit Na+/H+ antiporter MnhG subunit
MKRAVRIILCLIAAGLIVFGALAIGLALLRHIAQDIKLSAWLVTGGAVLMVLGVILLAASTRLAQRLTDDFDA